MSGYDEEEELNKHDSPVGALVRYVRNRNEVRQEIIGTYQLNTCCDNPMNVAKDLVIRTLNGGATSKWAKKHAVPDTGHIEMPHSKTELRK